MEGNNGLRILSLDGGGVRGLSSLIVLQYLMQRIAPDRSKPPKPCEFFDLIGGTSTGGFVIDPGIYQRSAYISRLLAIMLGRLQLDIETCIQVYLKLSETVFQPNRMRLNWLGKAKDVLALKGRFSSEELTAALKAVVRDYSNEKEDALMFEGDSSRCKAFVCAVRADSNKNVKFRTYPSQEVDEVRCKIWEAGRATSAASSFFDPIVIGPYREKFVDGATGTNNPVEEVYQEARALWPEREIQCFISIGTGNPGVQEFSNRNILAIVDTLKRIATETEETAESFYKAHGERNLQGRYFRFNVEHGLEDVGLEEYKKKNLIASRTKAYLSGSERLEKVGRFAALVSPVSTESNDIVKCQESFRWFEANDPVTYLSETVSALPGTLEWLDAEESFHHFAHSTQSAVLAVIGKPGCGKTMISRQIYLQMKRTATNDKKVPIYFSFKASRPHRQRQNSLLASMISQVLDKEHRAVLSILPMWREGLGSTNPKTWTDQDLCRVLKTAIASLPEYTFVLLVDALDQCTTPLDDVLETLGGLVTDLPAQHNVVVQLAIFSHPMDLSLFRSSNLAVLELDESADLHSDLALFISHEVGTKLAHRYKESSQTYIRVELTKRANGMYILVQRILDLLVRSNDSSSKQVEALIHSLPTDVVGIYDRFWHNIPIQDRARAARFLTIIMTAIALLDLNQIATAIATILASDEELSNPKLATEPENVRGDLIRLIGPYLRISSVVDVSHSSVKEFFTDGKRQTWEDEQSYQELAHPTKAHALLAVTCLRFLSLRKFDETLPFTRYAVRNFQHHIRQADHAAAPEIWLYLDSFLRPSPGSSHFWYNVVQYQSTWLDIDVADVIEFSDGNSLSQHDIADLVGDIIGNPHTASTTLYTSTEIHPALTLACIYDIPWLFQYIAKLRIVRGAFTYKDIFCHIAECFSFQSFGCLEVMGNLFEFLEPASYFDASSVLSENPWRARIISKIPRTRVKSAFLEAFDDRRFQSSGAPSSSHLQPMIDKRLLRSKSANQTSDLMIIRPEGASFIHGDDEETIADATVFFGLHLLRTNGKKASNLLKNNTNLVKLVKDGKRLAAHMLYCALPDAQFVHTLRADEESIYHLAAQTLDAYFLSRFVQYDRLSWRAKASVLNARDKHGMTPLHYVCTAVKGGGGLSAQARKESRMTVVRFLIEAGADSRTTSSAGETPLQSLCKTMEPDWACSLPVDVKENADLDLVNTVRLLWNPQQPIVEQDKKGIIPLNMACFHWPDDAIHQLLSNLAQALDFSTLCDGNGKTPLHFAAARPFTGSGKVIKRLLDLGCDPDIKDNSRHEALYYAVKYGRSSTVRLIITAKRLARKQKDLRQQESLDTQVYAMAKCHEPLSIVAPNSFPQSTAFWVGNPQAKKFGSNSSYERLTAKSSEFKASHKPPKSVQATCSLSAGDTEFPMKMWGPQLPSSAAIENEADVISYADLRHYRQTLVQASSWTVMDGIKKLQANFALPRSHAYKVAYHSNRRSEAARHIDSDDEAEHQHPIVPTKRSWRDPYNINDEDMYIRERETHLPIIHLRFRNLKVDRKIGRLIRNASRPSMHFSPAITASTTTSRVDTRKEEDFLWLFGFTDEDEVLSIANDPGAEQIEGPDLASEEVKIELEAIMVNVKTQVEKIFAAIEGPFHRATFDFNPSTFSLRLLQFLAAMWFISVLYSSVKWWSMLRDSISDNTVKTAHPTCSWTGYVPRSAI